MSRRSRWIFGTLAAVAVILIGVLILFDWNWLKGPIESQVAGRLGRPFRIHGDLEVELSRRPRVIVETAELANAPWGSDAPMARIDRAEVVIDLLKLLQGEVLLPAVSIRKPDLLLETRPDGSPNWQFGPSDEASPGPPALPRIGRLDISDASIRYHDLGSGRNATAELTQIAGSTEGSLKLIAAGKVQGQALDLQMTGAPLGQLETPAEPYPASLALELGRSDLRGDLTVDLSRPRPFISADLESDRLRLQDLTGTPADQPQPPSAGSRRAEPIPPSEASESAPIIAAAGVNFDALPEIDVDVQFRGDDLEAPEVRLARLELDLKLRDGVAVIGAAGEGTFRERQPVTFEIHAGTEDSLENPESRYPLDVSLHAGQTHASASGTVDQPLNHTGLDIDVTLQGPDLDKLGELLALPLPATPPYELAGKITHQEQEKRWNLVALSGTVGDSDIEGDVSLELSGQRPTVVADLKSNTFDLDELGVLVGAPPGTGPGETASREQREQAAQEAAANAPILPDEPFDMPEMRTIDARISFTGESVQAMKVPLEQMDAKLTLEAGHLRIDPVRVGLAGGQVEAAIGLDAKDVPIGDLDLTLRNVKLNQLLSAFEVNVGEIEMTKEGVGTFGGRAKLTVEGNSIHAMAAAANGEVAVVMGGGQINALIIEALGLDVGEILAVVAAGAEEKQGGMVPVQCFVSRFDVRNGVMTTRALVLETSDSTVTGSGTIDLGKETLDLRLLAHPKDASVLTASTPVAIQGTFRDPKIDVVSEELEEKGLAALALGVVLPVIGAIFPFIETGEAEGANCAALMKAAESVGGVSQGTTTRR
jgi:AsmA family protein